LTYDIVLSFALRASALVALCRAAERHGLIVEGDTTGAGCRSCRGGGLLFAGAWLACFFRLAGEGCRPTHRKVAAHAAAGTYFLLPPKK